MRTRFYFAIEHLATFVSFYSNTHSFILIIHHEFKWLTCIMVQLERGLHGVEPVVVANFPTKKFSDAFFSAVEDAQYVISFIVLLLT